MDNSIMGEMGEDDNKEELQATKPKVLIIDLGKVLLYSTEEGHKGKLNPRHDELEENLGEDYEFFSYFGLNRKLLQLLSELKREYPIHMITEGDIQEAPLLREELETAFDYDNIHSTGSLGLDKKDSIAYTHILDQLGLNPIDVLFVDDSIENINAAREAELQTIHFTSEAQTIRDLKKVLG